MTDASWETLSNQAVAAAGVVYFLALMAHLVQWASLRKLPADEVVTTGRTAMAGRLGVLLTVVAALVHGLALVARGMAADPNRVPWGNMYEFTLAGTFVVALLYLLLLRRFALEWMGPLVVALVLALMMTRRHLALRPGRPAHRGALQPVAGHPRRLGGDRHRRLHPRRHLLGALPAQGALDQGARLPRPRARAGVAGPDLLPDARLRLPGVDLRGAHHRADLGPPGVVVVLELGPQGGLGVHHLGRLRGLPARARHGRLEGPQRRLRRAGGPGDAVVQLHRDQLLQHELAALLRRARAGRAAAVVRRRPAAQVPLPVPRARRVPPSS